MAPHTITHCINEYNGESRYLIPSRVAYSRHLRDIKYRIY